MRFWSEHWDRAGLDGWLAALRVGKEERDFLGCWSVRSSSSLYVRKATRVVENLQVLGARLARQAWAAGPDFFGEEAVLADLDRHLRDQGLLLGSEVREQVERLRVADEKVFPEPADYTRQIRQSDQGLVVPEVQADAADGVPTPTGEEDGLEAEVEQAVEEREAEQEEDGGPSGFVISVTKGGRFRRLHYIGAPGCKRTPGIDYREYELCGEFMPEEAHIDALCQKCFPAVAGGVSLQPESLSAADSSESSSQSSCSAPGPGDAPSS